MRVDKICVLLIFIFTIISNVSRANPLDTLLDIEYEKLVELLPKTSALDSLSRINYFLAKRNLKRDLPKAIALFDDALAFSNRLGDERFSIQIKKSKSLALINQQKLDEAEILLGEALEYYKENGDSIQYGSSLAFYAYIYTEKNEYDTALKYAFDALNVYKNLENIDQAQNARNRIGIIYEKLENYDKALSYYEEIISICKQTGSNGIYKAALNNAGGVYLKTGNVIKAEKYLTETLILRKAENNPKSLAYGYESLAELALLKNEDEKALAYLDSTYLLFEQVGFRSGATATLSRKAILLLELGRLAEHKQAVVIAYNKLKEWNIKTNEEIILKAYADILFDEGESKRAYALLKKAIQLENDKNSAQQISKIDKLESELKKQRDETELESLSKQLEIQELSLSKRNLQHNYFLGFAALGIGLIFLLLYSNRDRKKKNALLSAKNDEISQNLSDKEVLMKEIHHRVKNNLQIVSSILSLQSRTIKDQRVKEAIVDSRDRVKSMALIHQKLYQEDNLKGVNMRDYFRTLVSSLSHSYNLKERDIDIKISSVPLILDIDSTIPIGLIVNELIMNALKYAFAKGDKGLIEVRLKEENENLYLEVQDDGKLIGDNNIEEGFGFQLIRSLARKLHGSLDIVSNNGLLIRLEIKNYKKIIT